MHDINQIAPDHITWAGEVFPAEYRLSSTSKSITVTLDIDGEFSRVILSEFRAGEIFAAALKMLKTSDAFDVDGEDLGLVLSTATPCKKRKPAAQTSEKMAHGPVPEKWFVGQKFTGKSWEIRFDETAGKTRVIFKKKPSQPVLDAVKAAGFYWSPSLKSWNKGLNFRAFRAAEKLRVTLHELTA